MALSTHAICKFNNLEDRHWKHPMEILIYIYIYIYSEKQCGDNTPDMLIINITVHMQQK